jgi:hypothetical protein
VPPHHLSWISPPSRGKSQFGRQSPRPLPKFPFSTPTWSQRIPGSCFPHPSQHGPCHPYMVSPSTIYGASTISPSSDRGIVDTDLMIQDPTAPLPPPTGKNTTTTMGR